MLGLGLLSFHRAAAVDYETIVLLLGTMSLVEYLCRGSLFEMLVSRAEGGIRSPSPWHRLRGPVQRGR